MTTIYTNEHADQCRRAATLLNSIGFSRVTEYEGHNQDRTSPDGRTVTIRSIGTDRSQLILIIDGEMRSTALIGSGRPAEEALLGLFARATAVRAPVFESRNT